MKLDEEYNIYQGMNKELEESESKDVNYAKFDIKGDLDLYKLLLKDGIKGSDIKKLYAPNKIEVNAITAVYQDKHSLFHFEINLEESKKKLGILIKKKSGIGVRGAKSKLEKYLNVKLKKIEKN